MRFSREELSGSIIDDPFPYPGSAARNDMLSVLRPTVPLVPVIPWQHEYRRTLSTDDPWNGDSSSIFLRRLPDLFPDEMLSRRPHAGYHHIDDVEVLFIK